MIYFASFFTLDPWGNDYIQVSKTDKMYLDESQAQKACDKGCIPIAVQLPEGYDIAPSWVIERGYDDCAFDDGHNPEFDWLDDLENRAARGDEEAIYHLQNL